MALVLVSCNQKAKEKTNNHSNQMNNGNTMMNNDSTMMHNNNDNTMMNNDSTMMHDKSNTMENHEEMYACPMHPEITGKKDEKCSKCGMKLTEPVPKKKEEIK